MWGVEEFKGDWSYKHVITAEVTSMWLLLKLQACDYCWSYMHVIIAEVTSIWLLLKLHACDYCWSYKHVIITEVTCMWLSLKLHACDYRCWEKNLTECNQERVLVENKRSRWNAKREQDGRCVVCYVSLSENEVTTDTLIRWLSVARQLIRTLCFKELLAAGITATYTSEPVLFVSTKY